MLDLAVVIVSYKVRDLLQKCLNSVFASAGEFSFRVCVVDNASDDDTGKMVRDLYPTVKLIENVQNIGYPAANNQGLCDFGDWGEMPPARYALLLNADTELPTTALATMIDFMDNHPGAGVAGPKLVMPDGRMDLACRRSFPTPEVIFYHVVQLGKLFPNNPRFARYNLTYLDPDELTEVDSVVGAFMLVRAKAIAQVGLLDERFFMYAEDLDWAKRIKEAGWKVFYNPAVSVLHVKRASSRQNIRRTRFEFERASLLFYQKHYQSTTPFLINILILLMLTLRGGKRLWPEIWRPQQKEE